MLFSTKTSEPVNDISCEPAANGQSWQARKPIISSFQAHDLFSLADTRPQTQCGTSLSTRVRCFDWGSPLEKELSYGNRGALKKWPGARSSLNFYSWFD